MGIDIAEAAQKNSLQLYPASRLCWIHTNCSHVRSLNDSPVTKHAAMYELSWALPRNDSSVVLSPRCSEISQDLLNFCKDTGSVVYAAVATYNFRHSAEGVRPRTIPHCRRSWPAKSLTIDRSLKLAQKVPLLETWLLIPVGLHPSQVCPL